ncbi:hypothetical protein QNF03_002257 [Vibrio cidicii]|nr:hypothetical protein [Vibrio cidicii]
MKIHQFRVTKQTIDLILDGLLIHKAPSGDIRNEIQKGDRLRLTDGDRFVYVLVCKVFDLVGIKHVHVNWISGGLGKDHINQNDNLAKASEV